MALNLFDQYGIKEVADVTIYRLEKDNDPIPFLFLDTLKVSTIEQTAESSDARGGKSNPKLISWDFGKEINVTMEDALFSPASMALMFAGESAIGKAGYGWESIDAVTKMMRCDVDNTASIPENVTDENGKEWKILKWLNPESGAPVATVSSKGSYMVEVEATGTAMGRKLKIDANDFPGTYKIVGDTYARNRDTGKDEYFQFIIPRAKMTSEQTLTLEAEGDPTTFNLNLTVLKPTTAEGMIELVQYSL